MQLSASGDTGKPQVIAEPAGEVARAFSELGATVVQQTAKLRQQGMLAFHCVIRLSATHNRAAKDQTFDMLVSFVHRSSSSR